MSDSYTVRFYDGVVRTVKPTKVKPFQRVRSAFILLLLPRLIRFTNRDSTDSHCLFFCVWKQKSRSEKSAVGSEGWEEGESEEEEHGGETEEAEKEKKEEEVEEKVTSEEKEGSVDEERKRRAEASSSQHQQTPAKKKTDDGKLHDV